jgi:hypothetical protein
VTFIFLMAEVPVRPHISGIIVPAIEASVSRSSDTGRTFLKNRGAIGSDIGNERINHARGNAMLMGHGPRHNLAATFTASK